MKLISCHIENFGKLNDFSFDFEEGTNVICADNGWGKSSFAGFIRAMFYGLEKTNRQSIEENDRKRYMPWQGGIFGGRLTFEADGREYIITRQFGKKAGDDTFELRDAATNLVSDDYSERIGEELFKIDKKSFMRSVFIGQGDCGAGIIDGSGATDDINAKVGNLADDTGDMNSYDSAANALAGVINKLSPTRATGSIKKREIEIAELEQKKIQGSYLPHTLNEIRNNIANCHTQIEELRREADNITILQKKVSDIQALQGKKDEWKRLKKNAEVTSARVESTAALFPKDNVPTIEEINRNIALCSDLDKIRERAAYYELSEAESQELLAGNTILAAGMPDESEIEGKLADIATLTDLRQKINSGVMSEAEKRRYEELAEEFADETESVSSISGKWNTRCNKKSTYNSNAATLSMLKLSLASAGKPIGAGVILLILGIIGVIGAILMLIFGGAAGTAAVDIVSEATSGGAMESGTMNGAMNGTMNGFIIRAIVLLVVGIIIAVIGLLVRAKDKSSRPEISPEVETLQRVLEEDEAFIAKVDAEVERYLERHGRFFSEDTVSGMLQEIYSENFEYNSLKRKAENAAANTDIEKAEEISAGILSFLKKYGMAAGEQQFTEAIYKLRGLCSRTMELRDKYHNHGAAVAEAEKVEATIQKFLRDIGIEPEQGSTSGELLNRIKDNADEYFDAKEYLAGAMAELAEFESANDITLLTVEDEEAELPSLDALHIRVVAINEKQDIAHKNLADMQGMLEDGQTKFDEWEENKARLEELKIIQAQEQEKYRLVKLAQFKLEAAKLTMTSKYSDPILNGFVKYFSMIAGEGADGFHVDANINVTVDAYGKQRNVNTLSSGYKDLIGVCLRLALVDAMYPDEEPMIVMDDPFTNLDDGKVAAAREFLDKVAERYQVIYFTCSRMRG